MRIVRGSAVEPSPWANGGGLTRELVDWPAAGDEPRWRLSMATCEGVGEFSSLPGVARTLMRVTGAMRLSFDGGDWVQLGGPLTFDGGVRVRFAAAPTCEDLGVMVWDGPAAELRVVEGILPIELDPGEARACVVVAGSVRLGDEDLGFRDTVVPGDEAVRLVPDGEATVVVVGR